MKTNGVDVFAARGRARDWSCRQLFDRFSAWLRLAHCQRRTRGDRSQAQLLPAVLRRPKPVDGPWQPNGALHALMRALSDPDTRVRLSALEVVAEFSREHAASVVSGAIYDVAPEVRCAAVRTAARLSMPAMMPALIIATEDPDPAVRQASREAIGTLANQLFASPDLRVLPAGDTAALKNWWRQTRLQELREAAT